MSSPSLFNLKNENTYYFDECININQEIYYSKNFPVEYSPHIDSTISYFSALKDENVTLTDSDNYSLKEEISQNKFVLPCHEEFIQENENKSDSNNFNTSTNSYNFFDINELSDRLVNKKKKEVTHRKKADDSIRKRIKTKIEKAITSAINYQLRQVYPTFNKLKFKKLSPKFIKDVTINFNKKCMKMSLEERYLYDFGGFSQNFEDNKKVIQFLKHHQNEEIISLLKMNVEDFAKKYFASSNYKHDLEIIKSIEGAEYAKDFDKLALGNKDKFGYVDYFLKTPGNKKSKMKRN